MTSDKTIQNMIIEEPGGRMILADIAMLTMTEIISVKLLIIFKFADFLHWFDVIVTGANPDIFETKKVICRILNGFMVEISQSSQCSQSCTQDHNNLIYKELKWNGVVIIEIIVNQFKKSNDDKLMNESKSILITKSSNLIKVKFHQVLGLKVFCDVII